MLDWRNHTINELGEHPDHVWLAECGHQLTVITTILHDEPYGALCQQCAATQRLAIPTPAPGWTVTSAGLFDELRASVAQRELLTQIVKLSEHAPKLTDAQLRNRLDALAHRARTHVVQRESEHTMTQIMTAHLSVHELSSPKAATISPPFTAPQLRDDKGSGRPPS